ncbi:MAG: ACT domain-containing protein [Thermoplasmatota archaeon]
MTRQLVVFIENKPGALAEIAQVLGAAKVNIEAILLEGSVDFGTARLHVDHPREGEKALIDAGFQVQSGDAIMLKLENKPGELARVALLLAKEKLNIEAVFGTTSGVKTGAPQLVLMVDDAARARKVLGIPSE